MSYQGQSPKVNRLRLNPRSTDPVNPSEGDLQYADGSARGEGLWVYKNGNWTPAGSGAAGSKNYLGTIGANDLGGDFELGTVGNWVLGNTSVDSLKLPTGSPTFGSGASANLSTAIVSSPNQLSGSYSLSYASSTATTAGNLLASPVFTVDQSDQAKPLTISFSYKVASGTIDASGTSINSFGIAIYDVTNSSWIVPAGVFAITQTSGVGKAVATFQTASNASQHRLVVYNANATSGAVTMYFDDFSVSPIVSTLGAAMTDWQSYTLTIGATTTAPTPGAGATSSARWRRVGDSMEIYYVFSQTAAGTAGSGTYLFPLPSGYSIDTTKVAVSTNAIGSGGNVVGNGYAANTSTALAANANEVVVIPYNTTNLQLVSNLSASLNQRQTVSSSNVEALSSTIINYSFVARVPIAGWSSNVQMSNDTDTRVVACSYYKNATQAVTANTTNITFSNKRFDTHSAFDGTTFTAPVTGHYMISGSGLAATTASGVSFIAYVDSGAGAVASIALGQSNSNGGDYATLAGIIFLNAGNKLTIRSAASVTISVGTNPELQIHRLSGPAVIAATETVAAQYYASANKTVSATQAIDFDTKVYDTHGAVTTGSSWKFTAPVTGIYSINAWIVLSTGATANAWVLYKNGTIYMAIGQMGSNNVPSTSSACIKLNAGEYIEVRSNLLQSVAGGSLSTVTTCHIEINKVGN